MPSDKDPKAEQLQTRSEHEEPSSDVAHHATDEVQINKRASSQSRYRPSHRGTFIGLAVVAVILLINGVVVWVVMQSQTDQREQAVANGVTLSQDSLDGIGISRNKVGGDQSKLFIGPSTTFDSGVTVKGSVTVAGQLTLNNSFSANSAKFANLQAGKTQLQSLNVNGTANLSNATLRNDLQVGGKTLLQGGLTVNQLATINNNLNVAGNLAVGGTLSARNFSASSLTSDTALTIGGHVITRGGAPGVSRGGAVGSGGTVSISGTDTAGTVAVNVGGGASGGTLASIGFRQGYSNTPKVVVSAVGRSAAGFYVNRSAGGFSIAVPSGLSPGSYAFDYIVMQ